MIHLQPGRRELIHPPLFGLHPPPATWRVIRLRFMQLSQTYVELGPDAFGRLVRSISIGRLKTYQIYEGFKVRAHLAKVNTEALRKAVPRFWTRISEGDEEFGKELAQAILISHLDLVIATLDLLGVPHDNGFFSKDIDPKPYFPEGWEDRVWSQLRETYPADILIFYINHLRWELLGAESIFVPGSSKTA